MYDLLLLLDMKELDNQAYLSVSFTSKQNLSAERLNSQKLFGFTSLKKIFYLQSYVYLIS